jgi:glycosyltransferase involved in cell wall biosynthesis
MIRVLHLRDTDRVCGPGKTIIETACATDKREFAVFVGLFLGEGGASNVYMQAAARRGVTVVPLVARNRFDPSLVTSLLRVIDEHQIDVVHSHEYKSDILTWLVRRVRRVPIVTTAHGWITNTFKSRVYTALGKAVLPRFDRVFAVSEGMKRALLACGVPDSRIVVLHNAIVTDNYDPARYERGFLRQRFGLPADARIIGAIGRLSPEKGQRDLLEAAARIVPDYDNVFFALVGDGPDQAQLEAMVRERNLQGRVLFTGHLHDVRPVYADIDILALTSHTEGLPNVVLEALTMNRPVLATDVGGTGEIVYDGKTGVLIPPHQPDAITRGLKHLLDATDDAQRLAQQGRRLVFEKFRFADRVAREEATYRELLGRRPRLEGAQ